MTDYVKVLEDAREQLVKSRRNVAEDIALAPTLKSCSEFLEVQKTLDAIENAIKDEKTRAAASDENFHRDMKYSDQGQA